MERWAKKWSGLLEQWISAQAKGKSPSSGHHGQWKQTEWDCAVLFYAILFSDCIGNGLNPTIKSKVDDLSTFRNEDFAHMPHGHLTDAEFQNAINKVEVAFQALGLSTHQIQVVYHQTSFPTEELSNVLKKVEVLEAQLNKEILSFCVLLCPSV